MRGCTLLCARLEWGAVWHGSRTDVLCGFDKRRGGAYDTGARKTARR